jgi:F-type H+-transporting ATPase subunit delta
MIVGSIARRYAKALFDLAVEQNQVEPWSEGLLALRAAVDASPEVRQVLHNPVYTRDERQALASRLAQALGLRGDPANLLGLLADRNRLAYLSDIASTFGRLADEKLGLVRAKVTSTVPLAPAEVAALEQKLAAASGGRVVLERAVDPALLGGVVTQVGSLVYDGSLRAQLEDLRRTLKQ